MQSSIFSAISGQLSRLCDLFTTRDVIPHDGRALRRSGGQAAGAGVTALVLLFSATGIAHASVAPGAMGGPFEATDAAPTPEANPEAVADAQFKSLFSAWKKLDTLEQSAIAIPSAQPVDQLVFTSNFGVRSDPFRGTAAMHAGVDIPGPMGTPIYATADGIVARAERSGGYGNMVDINHGKGIETRYGHMSKILVTPNSHVRRGQLIGLMGSTGRSTGSHLHYEVRIDGHAVNPTPFLTTGDMMIAMRDRAIKAQQIGVGGPVNR